MASGQDSCVGVCDSTEDPDHRKCNSLLWAIQRGLFRPVAFEGTPHAANRPDIKTWQRPAGTKF